MLYQILKRLSCSFTYRHNFYCAGIENIVLFVLEELDLQEEWHEIGCQTEPWLEQPTPGPIILFCWNGGNDGSTQTEIYIPEIKSEPKLQIVVKEEVNQDCDLDYSSNHDFTGFADIEDDKSMSQIAGVSREFFLVLLRFIVHHSHG